MSTRHAILGLALAVAGLTAGAANVLAGDEGEIRQELHLVRDLDPVVIDRAATLQRLDRLLAGVDEIAELTPAFPGRTPPPVRRLRDDDGAEDPRGEGADERERPGSPPAVERFDLRHLPPPAAGRVVEERLDEVRRELLQLRRDVLRAPGAVPPRVVRPMDDRAFRAFVLDVQRAPFVRDKVALVEDVAMHAVFTAEQVRIVVGVIPSWGQVDAAVAMYPHCVDPDMFYVVVNALTFASDRAELRRRIRD